MKFKVVWHNKNLDSSEVKVHGTYDSEEKAFDSILRWWEFNNYKPNYVRRWTTNGVTTIDYGFHSVFYYIVQESKFDDYMKVLGVDVKEYKEVPIYAKLSKWGNSHAVRLPAKVLTYLGIDFDKENEFKISISPKNEIILTHKDVEDFNSELKKMDEAYLKREFENYLSEDKIDG